MARQVSPPARARAERGPSWWGDLSHLKQNSVAQNQVAILPSGASIQARLWTVEDSLLRACILFQLQAADGRQSGSEPGSDLAETCRKLSHDLGDVRRRYNDLHGL